jgi:hypothetical protein
MCRAGVGVSFAMATHWIFNFAVGQLFLPAVAAFGVPKVCCWTSYYNTPGWIVRPMFPTAWQVFVFFAVVCIAALAFVNGLLVETKGKSFEEIEVLMSGGRSSLSPA